MLGRLLAADTTATASYAVLLGVLVALLTNTAAEMRRAWDESPSAPGAAARSDDPAAPVGAVRGALWRMRIGLAVLVVLAVGIFAAARMVVKPPVESWEVSLVVVALASGVLAAITLHFLPAHGRPGALTVIGAGVGVLMAGVAILVPAGVASKEPPKGRPYRVTGTCANHDCGLNAHTAPSTLSPIPARAPTFDDGDTVHIVCQRRGGWVHGRHGARSNVWDRLAVQDTRAGARWVADLFVTTPGTGRPTPSIPACTT